jgi:hypothetical protein
MLQIIRPHRFFRHRKLLDGIIAAMTFDYGHDLQSLLTAPCYWLIVRHSEYGIMGSLCVSPAGSQATRLTDQPKLQAFYHQHQEGWLISHLWMRLAHQNSADVKYAAQMKNAYQQLIEALAELKILQGVPYYYCLASPRQYSAALAQEHWLFDSLCYFDRTNGPPLVGSRVAIDPLLQETVLSIQYCRDFAMVRIPA